MGVAFFDERQKKMADKPVAAVAVAAAPVSSGVTPPPGAPPGGHMSNQAHCGIVTILIAVFLFPCVCCCPCDSVTVYVAPDGTKYLPTGAPYQPCACQCNN